MIARIDASGQLQQMTLAFLADFLLNGRELIVY